MISTVLHVCTFLAIAIILAFNIWTVAYFFWVLVCFVSQIFNLLSYVGASCETIDTVSATLT